jgi:hypothetical protein
MEIGRETQPVQATDEYRAVTRRVGAVLVVIGLLDIGLMIYCIATGQSYSSSLNIFAVVAGIFLFKGHLGAVRLVSWFSAFLFSGFSVGLLALFPWYLPQDYELLVLRAHPIAVLTMALFFLAVVYALLWVYKQLRSPAVLARRAAAGHSTRPPIMAFAAATAIVLFVSVMMQATVNGESGEKAQRLARQKYGPQFKYFVSRMSWSNDHVSAWLTAYNEQESKQVEVEWDQ